MGSKQTIRNCVEEILGIDDAYKFALWAFGEGFESDDGRNLWFRWNMEHGHLYEIDPSNCPEHDLPKMIDIWKKQLHTNKTQGS